MSRKITYVVGYDKRWCFPKDHVMEKTPCSTVGARTLMKEIFSSGKRTPKYLKDSVEDFVLFLRRHKSCPFKKLLVNICPESKSLKSVPFHQVIAKMLVNLNFHPSTIKPGPTKKRWALSPCTLFSLVCFLYLHNFTPLIPPRLICRSCTWPVSLLLGSLGGGKGGN